MMWWFWVGLEVAQLPFDNTCLVKALWLSMRAGICEHALLKLATAGGMHRLSLALHAASGIDATKMCPYLPNEIVSACCLNSKLIRLQNHKSAKAYWHKGNHAGLSNTIRVITTRTSGQQVAACGTGNGSCNQSMMATT